MVRSRGETVGSGSDGQVTADDGIDKLGLSVGQVIAAVIFAGLAGVVAALYPARKAAKMDVLRAITVE